MKTKLFSTVSSTCILVCYGFFSQSAVAQSGDPGFDELSNPFNNITKAQRREFFEGLDIFERNFNAIGPNAIGGGPLTNGFVAAAGPATNLGNSCFTCHFGAVNPDGTNGIRKDGGNGGIGGFVAAQATAWDESTGECDHLEEFGGPGFQRQLSPSNPVNILAQVRADAGGGPFLALDDYVPEFSSQGIPVGPVDRRTTNDVFGLGLVDAVRDRTFEDLADPNDANGDGVSGRVHWVTDHHGEVHVGRFGRKSEVVHLDEFNAEAFHNEQGVTNSEFPVDGVVVVANIDGVLQIETLDDSVADPELSDADLHTLNTYMRLLAPPKENKTVLSSIERRQALKVFKNAGCKSCHTPSLETGGHQIKALKKRKFRPYSNFLLHDMGDSLAEGCKGDATPREWRTEPLWGLRFVETYLHDGRALSVDSAIQMHADATDTNVSEAAGSVAAYNGLSVDDRDLLLDFLDTL